MRRMILLLGIFMFLAAALSACAGRGSIRTEGREIKVDGGSYLAINAEQLESMLENKDFILVNVHTPYEGEIEGTDLYIPYDKIEQSLSKLPVNKAAKIVVYCRTGYMSMNASYILVRLGFTNVWHLTQGMVGWDRDGYPILLKA